MNSRSDTLEARLDSAPRPLHGWVADWSLVTDRAFSIPLSNQVRTIAIWHRWKYCWCLIVTDEPVYALVACVAAFPRQPVRTPRSEWREARHRGLTVAEYLHGKYLAEAPQETSLDPVALRDRLRSLLAEHVASEELVLTPRECDELLDILTRRIFGQ